MAQNQVVMPFTAAAHRYREKVWTKTWTPSTVAQDISPPGFALKSYGYLRSILLEVSTSVAGSSGGTVAADGVWNAISQIAVTQPNGEEMFGGPTFSGYHAYIAAKHSGRFLNNDPITWPSYTATASAPQFALPINFEMNPEYGLGSLPNQDFSAPWKLQITANTSANLYTTAPTTTTPTLQLDVWIDCWSVPSPVNPLNPSIQQEVAPPLLGTLNKWTYQPYSVTGGGSNNVLLQRKGNAIRNLVFILRNSSGARIATTNFPDPLAFRWDGTVLRSGDRPSMMVDDEYRTRGGSSAATPVTADTGVISFQMADVSGVDAQGTSEGFGMNAFWGTVQSSTIEMDGTFGATAATLEVLTNDVQFVNLAGNPYAFAYSGYLQAPAQPSART